MPKVGSHVASSQDSKPEAIRPYLFHGLDLSWGPGEDNAIGACPFCGREKFSVALATGEWRCFGCNEGDDKGKALRGGNIYIFIRRLHALSCEVTTVEDLETLANDRKILEVETLRRWGACRSLVTQDWMVPAYNPDGRLCQLYRWLPQKDGKRALILTPTLGHKLHGVNLWDKAKELVYIAEGFWDGAALWEAMGYAKFQGDGLAATGNRRESLQGKANVLAVPGAGVFFDNWLPMFAGKVVNLVLDNDHPKASSGNGHVVPSAGFNGMKRAAQMMLAYRKPPMQVNYLRWGPEGYDVSLPHGYDVRDALSKT